MKRAIAICLLLFGSALSARAQEDEPTPPGPPIKSIRTERAAFQNGVEGARRPESDAAYDAYGNVVESTVYNENGSVYAKYAAKYAADGGLTEETYTDAKGEVGAHYLVHVDLPARRLEVVNMKPKGGNDTRTVSTLDAAGDVVEETTLDKNDKPTGRTIIKRNAQGQRLETLSYDAKDRLRSRTIYTHSAGRLSETVTYDGEGNVIGRFVYRYDAKGNRAEETFYNVGGASQWRYAYVYDAQGNWVTKSVTRLVKKNDQLVHEPSETVYRTITYDPSATPVEGQRRRPPAYNSAAHGGLPVMALKRIEPTYPEAAKRQRISGQVKVQILVDEQGHVISARALPAGDPHLKQAAESAAWFWTFTPPLHGGLPTRSLGAVDFNFNL